MDTRVLVVDDEPVNLELLTRRLQARYQVLTASSGQKALEVAGATPTPDVILLDIVMPEMNGYEVIRRLKSNEATCDIPVIFISALDEVTNKRKGLALGAVDYITKPFDSGEVLSRVGAHVRNHSLQLQLKREMLRFRTLTEAAFEGIFLHQNGRIVDANHEACRLLGQAQEEVVGEDLMNWVPEEHRHTMLSHHDEAQSASLQNSAGELTPVEVHTKRIGKEAQSMSVTAVRDLSLQRRMEQENLQLQTENKALRANSQERYRLGEIIGRSEAMQELYTLIAQSAASEYNVLIRGESGTGKELVAHTIHQLSCRKQHAMVPVNCGAISDTLFEREFFGHRKGAFTGADCDMPGFFTTAHGGSIFLDEIGELPPSMQVKLLRVLESGEFTPVGDTRARKADVRIIAATNRDLQAMVQQRAFRADLFYRVHVIELNVPPLRERRDDIPLLVEHILKQQSHAGPAPALGARELESLNHRDWPGNVRELANTLQRFVATGRLAPLLRAKREDAAPERQAASWNLAHGMDEHERRILLKPLDQTSWNRGEASTLLGINRRTLQRKMVKHRLRDPR